MDYAKNDIKHKLPESGEAEILRNSRDCGPGGVDQGSQTTVDSILEDKDFRSLHIATAHLLGPKSFHQSYMPITNHSLSESGIATTSEVKKK